MRESKRPKPTHVSVEKVASAPERSQREVLESDDNPLRGAYGPDPQAYVDALRDQWRGHADS